MDKPLQQAIADTVSCLDHRGLSYALIGGLAASIRGRVRATEDVDFIVQFSVDEAVEFLKTIDAKVLEPLFPGIEAVMRGTYILPLHHKTTGITIDLAIGVSGFEQQIVQRATIVQVADHKVPVATAEDIVLMKILAGRPQDDQDIEGILFASGKDFDWTYCLDVARQLQEALSIDIADRAERLRNKQS